VRTKNTFKAIIFDLDGTLLDSLEDIADSMNSVLTRNGLPCREVAEYKNFVGAGMEKLVFLSLPEGARTTENLENCLTQVRAEYEIKQTNKTKPYPGVPELLDALTQFGVRLAILSNKPHDSTLSVVGRLLEKWKFEEVIGAGASAQKKPDPCGAILIAERMGVSPKDFIYLGDTGIDMETANRAGMFAVGVLWGFRAEEELLTSGAKALIEKPMDLLSLIKS